MHDLGLFLAVTGTSGAGKTTALEGAVAELARTKEFSAIRLVTETTRSPRGAEVDGVDYHFRSHEEFLRRADAGAYIEYESYYGDGSGADGASTRTYLYGSPRADLLRHRQTHDVTFVSFDSKGAARVKQLFGNDVTMVMFDASDETLRQRLVHRGGVVNLEARLAGAAEERSIASRIPDIFTIRTDTSTTTGSMHRLLEIVRSAISLRRRN